MRDVLPELLTWWHAGATAAVGTVVGTWESAPRQPGATMVVGPDGSVAGSVSGGCVEGDVYALGEQVLEHGRPLLQRYGVSDADALAVGLTCGGSIEVFVEPVSRLTFPELEQVAEDVAAGRPVAVAVVVEHPDPGRLGRRLVVRPEAAGSDDAATVGRLSTGDGTPVCSLGSERVDAAVRDDVRGLLAAGSSELLTYGPDGERLGTGLRVFAACFSPRPRLLVFGAIDFAAALARLGAFLGYRVTVCDARPTFATAPRLPGADEVVIDWPHRYLAAEAAAGRIDARTAICVLTHDPKFDLPLLEVALRLPTMGYLGAMGSRRTAAERARRLLEAGITEAQLRRLSSPVGLDLGARTPEETAVSIAAEMIGLRWGGQGGRLVDRDGRIHHAEAGTSRAGLPTLPDPLPDAPPG